VRILSGDIAQSFFQKQNWPGASHTVRFSPRVVIIYRLDSLTSSQPLLTSHFPRGSLVLCLSLSCLARVFTTPRQSR
jgi:hypothetical protein